MVWSSHAIKRAQKEDPDMGPLYQALANHEEKPRWETILSAYQETKVYWTQWDRLTCLDEILYRRYSPPNSYSAIRQMQIPPAYRHEVLQQAQQGFTGGYMGERRTLEQVRRQGYWPGWAADATFLSPMSGVLQLQTWYGPEAGTTPEDDGCDAMGANRGGHHSTPSEISQWLQVHLDCHRLLFKMG